MSLTVKLESYRDEGESYNTPLGSQNTLASYVPTGGGSGGGGNSYVDTFSDQQYIWGYKYWRRNQTIDASLFVSKDVSIGGDLFVGGDLNGGTLTLDYLTVNQDVSISGDLWVDGEINGGLFGADVEIGNNLTVGNDVSVSGDLYVTGTINGGSIVQSLNDLIDTSILSPTIGQSLIYDGVNWINSDVSAYDIYTEYLDGSLALRDASINNLYDIKENKIDVDSSLSDLYNYVDNSLGLRDVSIEWLQYNTLKNNTNLNDLNDVSISNVNIQDIIFYSSDNVWKNATTINALTYFQNKITNTTPASDASGTAGDWTYDSSYLYICTYQDTWCRILMENNY